MDESSAERLGRIRAHCDNGIRYYTWALMRMPSIPEQAGHVPQIEDARNGLTRVLALVEGATDDRGAGIAAREIVTRYERAVLQDGWEPSFAAHPPSDGT